MKLNTKNVIFASLAFGWITIFWFGYDNLIQTINIYTFGLTPTQSGSILAIDNILGLFVLPLFGWLSDKCKSKFGKRTPYIFLGTAVSLLGFLFVGIFAQTKHLVGYILSLTITLFAMAAYRPAALALVPDITPESLRSRANAVNNLISALFNIVAIVIILCFLTKTTIASNTYIMPIVLCIIASSVITAAIFFWKVKEPGFLDESAAQQKLMDEEAAAQAAAAKTFDQASSKSDESAELSAADVDCAAPATAIDGLACDDDKNTATLIDKMATADDSRSVNSSKQLIIINKIFVLLSVFFFYMAYNALVSNFNAYALEVLNLAVPTLPLVVTMVGAIAGFIPSAKFAAKHGRRWAIFLGYMLMIIPFLLVSINSLSVVSAALNPAFAKVVMFACFGIAGIGYGFVMVNIYPLFLELSGKNNVGQGTGIFAMAMTIAMIITPILAGFVIEQFGELWNVTYLADGEEKFGDYRMLVPYSAINLIIAVVCALLIKEKNRAKIELKKGLDAFDVDC